MTTTATTAPPPTTNPQDDAWLRTVQVSTALVAVGCIVLAVSGTFFETISEGDFRFTADYWYTAAGLPITIGGIGMALGVHRLQHGADGGLGRIGTWVNVIALVELFVQLAASVVQGAEIRWGPSYPIAVMVSFVGLSLLAAGSWRTGVLPRWVLVLWPPLWVLGSLGAVAPMAPVVLVAFLGAFGVVLTARVRSAR